MIGWYLKIADPVLAPMWKVSTEKSTYDFLSWEVEKDAWINEFHEKARIPKLRGASCYLRRSRAGLGCSRFRRSYRSRSSYPCLDSRVSPEGVPPDSRVDFPPISATKYLLGFGAGTLFYNLLDCPVGSVPVTRVNPKLDALPNGWLTKTSINTTSSKEMDKILYGEKWGYNADAMEGLPVGIQLVGRKWEEEKVVEMMKVVDAALGERGFGPDGWQKWRVAHPN